MKPGYTIVNHRLMGEGVVHLSCSKNTRRLEGPDMIVLHYTAGVSAASSADYLVRPEVKASGHRSGRQNLPACSFPCGGVACRTQPLYRPGRLEPLFHRYRTGQSGTASPGGWQIPCGMQPDSRPGGSVRGLFGRGVVLLARLYGGAGGGVGKDSPFAS